VVRRESFEYTCSRVGRWWNDDTEIDIVGVDTASGLLLFGNFVSARSDWELPDSEVVNTVVEEVEWEDGDPTLVHAPFTLWNDDKSRSEYREEVDAFHRTALTDVLY